MTLFWILWIFCAGILVALLYYFLDSVYTTPGGPPAAFFKAAVPIIGLPITMLLVSPLLASNGFYVLANCLLAIPDILGLLYLLWLLIYATSGGRKN
ncbi:MAG: hypothetical protein ABIN80_28335 [Dyadobacter sp.]|uniref:hypothetical protein n=1 Tax=Dyadobacter sp. TaxID=1914288 RepID=UPI0032632297